MQQKIELLARRVHALIEEVQTLRQQNEDLELRLMQKEEEAGLTRNETQQAIERLDALIQTLEQTNPTTRPVQEAPAHVITF